MVRTGLMTVPTDWASRFAGDPAIVQLLRPAKLHTVGDAIGAGRCRTPAGWNLRLVLRCASACHRQFGLPSSGRLDAAVRRHFAEQTAYQRASTEPIACSPPPALALPRQCGRVDTAADSGVSPGARDRHCSAPGRRRWHAHVHQPGRAAARSLASCARPGRLGGSLGAVADRGQAVGERPTAATQH